MGRNRGVDSRRLISVRPLRYVLILLSALAWMACAGAPEVTATVEGRLVAGPVCPVESDPPDPQCAPRPVEGAEIVATTIDGRQYRTESGPDGHFELSVAAGEVTVEFLPVDGLMGIPEPILVVVTEGDTLDLGDVGYDTGIR